MGNHYLFFVSVAYSYPILRPLQEEIKRRGDEVAWYIEQECPVMLKKDEKQLKTFKEVSDYAPIAVFAPGNYIYDFFPGVKVSLFHGYPINKRGDEKDDHFAIRGWFDVYCTQGESSTVPFKALEKKLGFFKVYETGWCKADTYVRMRKNNAKHTRPTVLYSTTFTRSITSAPALLDTITRLVHEKDWNWVLSFHPKFSDAETLEKYRELARTCPNVTFHEGGLVDAELLSQADVLLSDASSVIVESMLMDKPVVTFRNTTPGNHLLDVTDPEQVEAALEQALTRPDWLMENIHRYINRHEGYLDGHSSARVLNAIDDYITNYQGCTKAKPLNLVRKFKLRLRVGYPILSLPRQWVASL